MRKLFLCLAAVALAWSMVAQSESPTPTPTPTPKASPAPESSSKDSAMVRAAKSSSAAKSSKRIRITNEDVKKSTGKLSIVSAAPVPAAAPTATPTPEPIGMREERELAESKAAVRKRYEDAAKRVSTLERTLNSAEQDYYDADEPGDRELIERRFMQAKKDLDEARAAEQRAREELSRIE